MKLRWLILPVAVACTASPAAAQYFGRNRVQYHSFDFQVLRTEHFDLYFYAAESVAARQAARMAERWYTRLSTVLGDTLQGRQPVILYASPVQFQQTNAISGDIGEGTGGVTESLKRRVVLPFSVSLAETDHVLGHELVHAFQFDLARRGRGRQLPLWFMEGMAEYLSLGPVDAHTAMWLRDALREGDVPKVRDLDHPKYFPYRYGHAFWAYVGGRWGDEVIGSLLRSASRSGDPMAALRAVLKVEPDSLTRAWHAALSQGWPALAGAGDAAARRARAQAADSAPEAGRPLLNRRTTGGEISLAPALSPDGRRVVFLSERGRFSIDMFVADATTGRVERGITHTALDGHLESLQFIHSAGSWHPDGRRFAFAGIVRGRAALVVMDLDRGEREREVVLRDVDEVLGPSWSPDGRRLVFTGQVGGLTDLFVYDVESGALRRLTNDASADLHPAWSPDGRRIAFTTDRFGTRTGSLRYGEYRLALLDVASGEIAALPGFGRGKQINPQWSGDSRSLFFVADPDGISNVYRLDLAGGDLFRITDLTMGASGITALSPAISTATQADRLAVSLYRDGNYEVVSLEGSTALAGRPAGTPAPAARVAALPPNTGASGGRVAAYLDDPDAGLPSPAGFVVRPYRSSLSVDYVAQPYLVAGADRFGAFVGGGATLFWSSMLGDRQLTTGLQVYGGPKDIAAQVGYTNLAHRLDWAAYASQVPYIAAAYGNTLVAPDTAVYSELRQRQTNRQLAVLTSYPFSRVQRLELLAGLRHIAFDNELRETLYDPVSGLVYDERRSNLAAPDGLFMGQGSAALVYDNSVFGGTGPVAGRRWRLEAAPTVGSLTFVGALADLRQYVMPVRSVTLAARVLHYGRYGGDGEDARLSPLFLGYQSLVRGYSDASFEVGECVPTAASDCPVFDQLLGSRVLVGNVELRLPLLGPLGTIARSAFPPLDLALFADGGVAWTSGETPALFNGTRAGVASVGAALRLNLFGFAIGEVDYVRPLDRPGKGWFWQFGLNPGF